MRLMAAALALSLTLAVVAAVFALWPVVADAPWETSANPEGNPVSQMRCEGALQLRAAAVEAMGSVDPDYLEFLDHPVEDHLDQAEREIRRYCR